MLLSLICEKFVHTLHDILAPSAVMMSVLSFDALTRAYYDVTGVTFAVYYDIIMHRKLHACDVTMGTS